MQSFRNDEGLGCFSGWENYYGAVSVLVNRVEQAIEDHALLRPGMRLMVAVSGGLDSMVLLHILVGLAGAKGWRLAVAHFNHRLRGQSSSADERLVRKTAAKLGLPCFVQAADVRGHAREHKISIEMAARQLRHAFFVHAAREFGADTVAMAHHAEDQAELFFLRLLRGAAPQGLAGMRWVGPSPADSQIRLVRPLLECAKDELREYAKAGGILFREDATNRSTDILRNRVRHELLPLLQTYQPAVIRTILRNMDLLAAESAWVNENAQRWLEDPQRAEFVELPVALQRRVLLLQLQAREIDCDYDRIELLRGSEQPVTLGPGLVYFRNSDGLLQKARPVVGEFTPGQQTFALKSSTGEIEFNSLHLKWCIEPCQKLGKPKSGVEFFDAHQVGPTVTLRHWQPGDRFQPIGMAVDVKLQDLFTNLKIPREQRRKLVIATTEQGEIFWIEGMRIGEKFKTCRGTKRQLRWEWSR